MGAAMKALRRGLLALLVLGVATTAQAAITVTEKILEGTSFIGAIASITGRQHLRALVLALALIGFGAPAHAAVAFVQETTCTGNDCTLTFAAAPSASNHILVTAVIGNTAQTVDLTGTPGGAVETVLHGPADHTGVALRGYIWCLPGDGADNTIVVTTSVGAVADAAAIEVSGLSSCTEDGTSQTGETTAATSHDISSNITTTVDGSILFGMVRSNTIADFTVGMNMTSVPTGNADFGASPGSLGLYRITVTAGSYGCPLTSVGSETALVVCAAIQPAGGGGGGGSTGRMLLMGVGE